MSSPWMPFYVADYLADTAHLNAAEHGAYMLLIMHYWRTGKLPNDDRQLARIARMTTREWATSRAVLAEFFDAEWRHKRIDFELAKSAQKANARAVSGSRGGKAKALKTNDATLANATFLPQQNTKQNDDIALASSSQPQSQAEREGETPHQRSTDSAPRRGDIVPPPPDRTQFDEVESACRKALGEHAPADLVIGPMVEIVRTGAKLARIVAILEAEADKPRRSPIRTWRLWAKIVAERLAEPEPPNRADRDLDGYDQTWWRKVYPDHVWREIMTEFVRTGEWLQASSGYRPGHALCVVPAHILDEFRPQVARS